RSINLQLCVCVWRWGVTLMKGSTLTLSCPLDNAISAEWQNPHGIMFFNHEKGLGIKDRRFTIEKLSSKWFDISVSDVTFKDGGDYRCTQYGSVVTKKVFKVTVLGELFVIISKSTFQSALLQAFLYINYNLFYPSHTLRITAKPHHTYENHSGKHNSEDLLRFEALKTDKLCCIVPQPHLNTEPLMNCVKVRATCDLQTCTSRLTTPMIKCSCPNSAKMCFDMLPGNLEEMEKRSGEKANGTLLIFLVTCLIVALSVVVLFLAIKLRRAHIHWKRENEDSDPSIESNKSKSSDEERWWMGIFNIAFTKYVTEEPTGVSIVTTPDAMPTKVNLPPVEASPSHFSPHYDAPAPVRETEL
uniref:Immunoglobulin domain-containing protein n=1 Tax=Gadus morhua TaxID=8049 RepID=A0A8C5AFU4_GADMO